MHELTSARTWLFNQNIGALKKNQSVYYSLNLLFLFSLVNDHIFI